MNHDEFDYIYDIMNDIHIHGCIDETSLRHLKYPFFLGSLFGLDFEGGYSFTSWMKENMDDYFYGYYIPWEKRYMIEANYY